jgi:hypothetical protein
MRRVWEEGTWKELLVLRSCFTPYWLSEVPFLAAFIPRRVTLVSPPPMESSTLDLSIEYLFHT